MWLPVSTVAALCVLLDITDGFAPDKELDLIFKERSKSQWEKAWHEERHARCRDTLLRHLYWACEKDIYQITRRSKLTDFNKEYTNIATMLNYPWISENKAKYYLRSRRGSSRRSGSSITAECCNSKGCTWEEYAEYCPTNKRYTSYV